LPSSSKLDPYTTPSFSSRRQLCSRWLLRREAWANGMSAGGILHYSPGM
jgi:hypothetical protein